MSKVPRVLNKYRDPIPTDAVYIGRPSKWGNPFVIGKHGDRATVIALFEQYLLERPHLIAEAKAELRGRDLVCFCSPQACHGDVLLRIANS